MPNRTGLLRAAENVAAAMKYGFEHNGDIEIGAMVAENYNTLRESAILEFGDDVASIPRLSPSNGWSEGHVIAARLHGTIEGILNDESALGGIAIYE